MITAIAVVHPSTASPGNRRWKKKKHRADHRASGVHPLELSPDDTVAGGLRSAQARGAPRTVLLTVPTVDDASRVSQACLHRIIFRFKVALRGAQARVVRRLLVVARL